MNKWKFEDKLHSRGFKNLGSGHYSSAWWKPGNSKILKVGHPKDNWLRYILWAMSHGYVGNHAPRVDSFKVTENYFVASVERLYAIDRKNRKLVDSLTDSSFFMENLPAYWIQFGKDFTKEFYAPYGNDLKWSNWLQRANGELVLNDPLSTGNSSSVRRYRSMPGKVSSLHNELTLVWC